jgi:hypothetical protein
MFYALFSVPFQGGALKKSIGVVTVMPIKTIFLERS